MAPLAFPVIKLSVLAFKQISKPIKKVIQKYAKDSQFFRQNIAMPPAQFYNWVETKLKMNALNLGKPITIPQLNETMAIELGASLLSEIIIFTICATLLTLEYIRQSNIEAKKQEIILIEKKELINTISNLSLKAARHDVQLKELARVLADLESRRWFRKSMMH